MILLGKILSTAQTKFEGIGDQLGVAQCLQSLSDIHMRLHYSDIAQESLSAAQTKFEDIGHQLGAAQCLWSLGNIQIRLQNYDIAQEMLSTAQTKLESIGDQLGEARCLQSFGILSRDRNMLPESFAYIPRAKDKFSFLGRHTLAERCSEELAQISGVSQSNSRFISLF